MAAPSSPSALPEPLVSYLAAWNAAGSRWDCAALAGCFTEDALFFGGRPEHSVGRHAIEAYFRSYIGIIASCTLSLREQHIVTDLGANALVAQGYGDFSFILADGLHTRSVVRTTLILVHQRDRWRARVQHIAPPPAEPPIGRNG